MKRILYTLAGFVFTTLSFVSCGESEDENTINGFEYVDLGLPSGTKWAASNVGAKTAESKGTYFAWGEVTESNYTEVECETFNQSASDLAKNGVIQNLKLTSEYDAATHMMGIGWSTPTKKQFEELIANCTWTWQTKPAGYNIVAKNGNSIFLPATGYMSGDGNLNYASQGYYWTSEIESNSKQNAYGFEISSKDHNVQSFYRDKGMTIRAVTK